MSKVSVIITTYGKPFFLKKAICSVLAQSFKEIELIVVDDNSPNTEARSLTEDLVFYFINSGNSIIYLKHESNKNGAVARNTGIEAANGKYIAFLDGDDEFHPERIDKCFRGMEKSTEDIAGIYTGCEFRRGGKKYFVNKNVQAGNFLISTLACTYMIGSGSNIFIRKSVVDELKGFDENFLRHQDYEFLVRVFEKYSLAAIPEVLLIKNNDNTNLPNVEAVIEIKGQYLNKFNSIIVSLKDDERKYIYFKNYISIAEHALKYRKLLLARNFYNRAKDYGTLSINEVLRRFVLTFLNFEKR